MQQTTERILNIFEGFRMSPIPHLDQYEITGKSILADKIDGYVRSGDKIEFVMLGFPHKSTNTRDKVLGDKPDMGEEITLKNFADFGRRIKEVYPAGINVNMASDGYVFNNLLGVPDNTVARYREISEDLGKDAPMSWWSLPDFYGKKTNLSSAREKLMAQFGITPEKLEQEILFNTDIRMVYTGMTIFMMEELATGNYPSKNQLQKAAKILTRNMMMANEAYSNLISSEFKDAIRLSMHPSVNNGKKYSFKLIHSDKARHSAWHCTIVDDNGEIITMHRKDAVEAGYQLVYKNGQPYYFVKQ